MKSIFTFKMHGSEKPFFLVASLGIHLMRLENESGLKFEPTGMQDDDFGRSYIRRNTQDWQVFDMPTLRKHIQFYNRCGASIHVKY